MKTCFTHITQLLNPILLFLTLTFSTALRASSSLDNIYIDADVTGLSNIKSHADSEIFHLFSHGKAGHLFLEGKWLDAKAIAAWLDTKQVLRNKKHLNIYACEFARGRVGDTALKTLEQLLNVSISASDDITGANGDWVLEKGETSFSYSFPEYPGNLQCTCEEKIYLNEIAASPTGTGIIHKFDINTNGTLAEIGSPWFSSTEFPFPHGIGFDLNGFLYVGEEDSAGEIRRLTCDGELFTEAEWSYTSWGQYNIASIDNQIYFNDSSAPNPSDPTFSWGANQIRALDICTQAISGGVQFCSDIFEYDWGFFIDPRTEVMYASGFRTGSNKSIYRFTAADFDTDPMTCIDPLPMAAFPDKSQLPPAFQAISDNRFRISGITTDENEDIYVVIDLSPSAPEQGAFIQKYSGTPPYNLLATSPIDNDGTDGVGWFNALGIVYSETSQMLYVSALSATESCITGFSTDLQTVTEIIGPAGTGLAKGINIVNECCPNPTAQTSNQVYCTKGTAAPLLFLEELFPCDGIICDGRWEPDNPPSAAIFNSCDVSVAGTPGCYSYTKEGDGVSTFPGCAPFEITINLEFIDITAPEIANSSTLSCANSNNPDPFTFTTGAAGSGSIVYRWQSSTSDCMTGFTDIPTAPTDGTAYDPGSITQETYYRLITEIAGTCVSNTCADTSNCVVLTPASPCPCNLIDANKSGETCNSNGTNSDVNDDYITFNLNPTGSDLGASYNVSADGGATVTELDGSPATMISYGTATAFRLQNGSADGTVYTITITDNTDPTCTITSTVQQNSCSSDCSLSAAGENGVACNQNGTSSDASDDYITFDLDPTGLNLGTEYSVSVNNGATVTLLDGSAATGISYGAITAFRLQNGSADGTTYTVTITDDTHVACTVIATIRGESCSTEPCPSLTFVNNTMNICEGSVISELVADTDASVNIDFVYFNSQQTSTTVYTGGTTLGTSTPSGGSAVINNINDFTSSGVYYIYARLSSLHSDPACRPFAEIILTVDPGPNTGLSVSDERYCENEEGTVTVSSSEFGFSYTLVNSSDSPVGPPVTGTGGDIELPVPELSPGLYNFSVTASNGSGCELSLADPANIEITACDIDVPFNCSEPLCHEVPNTPLIYFGSGVSVSGTEVPDDGIIFPNDIHPNNTIRIPVNFYNNTGNQVYIQAWIDWNGNNEPEPVEQVIAATEAFDAGNLVQTVFYSVTVPANAVQGQNISSLFRISTDPTIINNPCGSVSCATDGEAESFNLRVTCPSGICLPLQTVIRRN